MSYHKGMAYEAYAEVVNIDLFNATLALAAQTSEAPGAMNLYRQIVRDVIWGEVFSNVEEFFSSSGLRYLGEILERYEENIGGGQENFRAVALALGYATPILTASMFIGNQKENFVQELEQRCGHDVYLLGAKCLLTEDDESRKEQLEAMSKVHYTKTEEATFVLSLFSIKPEGYYALQPQLGRLWGVERSIPMIDNIGVLDWMIHAYEPCIRSNRKKDCAVLRSMLKLSSKFVNEDGPVFKSMKAAGYSELEISYASIWLILKSRFGQYFNPDGKSAEKAAAQFCAIALNSKEDLTEDILTFLEYLFCYYDRFKVRYEENDGLWNAVRYQIHPVNANIAVWIFKNLKVFYNLDFDVFDSKWDLLAQELEKTRYLEQFSGQLLAQKGLSTKELNRWIDRYHTLTGLEYVDSFAEHYGRQQECFNLLVDSGIIDLWDYFCTAVSIENKEAKRNTLRCVAEYACHLPTHRAFDFVKKMVERYTFVELDSIFENRAHFHNHFVKWSGMNHHSVQIDIKRDFLSPEEEKELLEWIDTSVYLLDTHLYNSFVAAFLADTYIQSLYSKETLSQILKGLVEVGGIKDGESTQLKQALYSEEEFAADRQAAAEAKAEAERQKEQGIIDAMHEKLTSVYNGTIVSLGKYLKNYYWENERRKAISVLFPTLVETAARAVHPMPAKELACLFSLCGKAVKLDAIPREQLFPLIEKILKEEQQNGTNA